MRFGISLGMIVESSVAVLLAVTIGYCVILNARLQRLHADRDALGKMVTDLVQAPMYASEHPVTGQIERSNTLVCWV